MKMPSLLKRSPIVSIENALANLATRRETLEARKADAVARLDAARSARKNALASDTAADLTSHTRTVRECEDEIETLDGVLGDLAEQVTAQQLELAEAKDADVRAGAARQLEKIATAFDKAAAEMEGAMESLGRAAAAMVAALPETLKVVDFADYPPTGQNERERLVAVIVAEGIAKVFPAAIPTEFWGARHGVGHIAGMTRHFDLDGDKVRTYASAVEIPSHSAREAAGMLVSDRLRKRAELIVAGGASPDLADQEPFKLKAPEPPAIKHVEVFASADFCFRLKAGQPCRHPNRQRPAVGRATGNGDKPTASTERQCADLDHDL